MCTSASNWRALAANEWLWRSGLGPADDADRGARENLEAGVAGADVVERELEACGAQTSKALDDGRHAAGEALGHSDDHPPGRSRSARPPRGAPSPSRRPARGSSASVKATKVAQAALIGSEPEVFSMTAYVIS